MPGVTSSTGLIAGRVRPIYRPKQKKIELCGYARQAPFVLRPFAGLFNPYPYGCSVLCNHPADCEVKDVVRKAKDSWAAEGKALLLPTEVEMIRAGLMAVKDCCDVGGEGPSVPEELFRKYTDTDSRPLTPVPTLASNTPFTYRTCNLVDARVRTTLVLDLRTKEREQECETLTWHALTLEPPPLFSRSELFKAIPYHVSPVASVPPSSPTTLLVTSEVDDSVPQEILIKVSSKSPEDEDSASEEMPMRRRGKRRRKRKCRRGSTYGQQSEVRDLPEPTETQVSQIRGDSRRPSMKPFVEESNASATLETPPSLAFEAVFSSSFIPPDVLKHLCRDLDRESVEWEFSPKKKLALEEALRVKKDLQLNVRGFRQTSQSLPLSGPRVFSRQNARFEILDSQSLAGLNSLTYLSKHVYISETRKFIFSHAFGRYCNEGDENARLMPAKDVFLALGETLGKAISEEQEESIGKLLGDLETNVNFRSWCGICALVERLFASLPDRDFDPPDWLERTDFECLERRLKNVQNPDLRLVTLLRQIRDR